MTIRNLCGSGNKDNDMEHFKMMGGGNVSNPSGAKDDDSFLSDGMPSQSLVANFALPIAYFIYHLQRKNIATYAGVATMRAS